MLFFFFFFFLLWDQGSICQLEPLPSGFLRDYNEQKLEKDTGLCSSGLMPVLYILTVARYVLYDE